MSVTPAELLMDSVVCLSFSHLLFQAQEDDQHWILNKSASAFYH